MINLQVELKSLYAILVIIHVLNVRQEICKLNAHHVIQQSKELMSVENVFVDQGILMIR